MRNTGFKFTGIFVAVVCLGLLGIGIAAWLFGTANTGQRLTATASIEKSGPFQTQ